MGRGRLGMLRRARRCTTAVAVAAVRFTLALDDGSAYDADFFFKP
jgi:hypothetical protein